MKKDENPEFAKGKKYWKLKRKVLVTLFEVFFFFFFSFKLSSRQVDNRDFEISNDIEKKKEKIQHTLGTKKESTQKKTGKKKTIHILFLFFKIQKKKSHMIKFCKNGSTSL